MSRARGQVCGRSGVERDQNLENLHRIKLLQILLFGYFFQSHFPFNLFTETRLLEFHISTSNLILYASFFFLWLYVLFICLFMRETVEGGDGQADSRLSLEPFSGP